MLLDGKPVNSCVLLAAQAEGHTIQTIEALGEHPEQGWKMTAGLHPLQQAFVESGAIQCGYCTPAQILAAKELLERNPDPTEAEVREALSGVLCRCTGYLKPVQAVLRAAAVLRGEAVEPLQAMSCQLSGCHRWTGPQVTPDGCRRCPPEQPGSRSTRLLDTRDAARWSSRPRQRPGSGWASPSPRWMRSSWCRASRPLPPILKCAACWLPRCCTARMAHARIKQHRCQPGARTARCGGGADLAGYPAGGLFHCRAVRPDPRPLDTFSLDNKVRFVGDRVAFVAAETAEIAEQALKLIEVEYEPLPALLDPTQAMQPGAPRSA